MSPAAPGEARGGRRPELDLAGERLLVLGGFRLNFRMGFRLTLSRRRVPPAAGPLPFD
ncbi:MAG: hypothetical protein NTY18_07735 [Deltaproteobacteria bacterium]|nr:hypothetical protein [Deltaproteobacteria bacterium]